MQSDAYSSEPALPEVLRRWVQRGWRCDLVVDPGGAGVVCPNHGHVDAHDLIVDHYRRFEGISDPDDMSILLAVHWTDARGHTCRGNLVLPFGPTATPESATLLESLELEHAG